jgi:hypothetical protein
MRRAIPETLEKSRELCRYVLGTSSGASRRLNNMKPRTDICLSNQGEVRWVSSHEDFPVDPERQM